MLRRVLLWLLLAFSAHGALSVQGEDASWLSQEAYGDFERYCILSAAKTLRQRQDILGGEVFLPQLQIHC